MPAGKQKLQYEVNLSANFIVTFYFHPNESNWLIPSVHVCFAGNIHQGFKLSGLLQHDQRFHHSFGSEGERWKKEVRRSSQRKPSCCATHPCQVIFTSVEHF